MTITPHVQQALTVRLMNMLVVVPTPITIFLHSITSENVTSSSCDPSFFIKWLWRPYGW